MVFGNNDTQQEYNTAIHDKGVQFIKGVGRGDASVKPSKIISLENCTPPSVYNVATDFRLRHLSKRFF